MRKINLYSGSLAIALILLLATFLAFFLGKINLSGVLVLGFFGMLAIGFSGYKNLNGYVFTTMIFAGVTLALYFPKIFVQIGDYKMSSLIIPLIQIIMFGMGTSMSIKDFASIFKSPKGVVIGVTAQLGIMPIIGFILAKLSNFPPEIAAGIVLIGCSPSGVASNVMAYLARANLALSITMLICLFIPPPCYSIINEIFSRGIHRDRCISYDVEYSKNDYYSHRSRSFIQ